MMRLPPGRADSQFYHRTGGCPVFLLMLQQNSCLHNNQIPSRPSMQRKTQFSLLVPFAQSNRRPANPAPHRSISQVLAETAIKQHNLEYQQLLIRAKQLEIRMGELKAELEGLHKRRIKADRLAEEEGQRKERAMAQLKEKQCYLQRYYDELDRKFRGGKEELFAGLKKLQQNLLEMYQRDERRIRESLQSEREELAKVSDLVGTQRMQRDLLKQQLRSMQRVKEVDQTATGHTDKEQILAENHFLREQIDRLVREKKSLESEERNLKRILNIEEEHKKHGAIIAAGISKMFGIRVKQQRYKEAVSQDYAKNISGLREIILKRRSEKKTLMAQLAQKKSKLAHIRQQNSKKNKQYGQLQDQLFRLQRK